jgi:integrase
LQSSRTSSPGTRNSGDQQARLFFGREHGGGTASSPTSPFDPDNFGRRYLKPALKRAGLPYAARTGVRFHDLRHTCASLWFEAGIPLAVISRWLGHASVAVTDRVHVHLRPDDDYPVWEDRFRAAQAESAERRVVRLGPHGASLVSEAPAPACARHRRCP